MRLPKTLVRLAIAGAAVAAVFVPAAPASAAASPVFVENYASSYWPVSSALNFVDQYTGNSWFILARCRSGYKCLRIYERTIRSDWAAVTYNWSWGSQVYLNPAWRSASWYARRSIAAHEFTHSRNVTWHTYGCTDVMHYRVFCWGSTLPPYRFNATQRAVLWRN